MEPSRRGGPYAGFITRALAFIIDLAALSVALLLVAVPIQSIVGFFTLYGVFARSSATGQAVRTIITIVTILVSAGLGVAYPIGFWVLLGQTPGKVIMGLRVVRLDGRRLTLGSAMLRYLGYWVSAAPLFLGFAWILVDDRRQAWHDKIAGTCVVYAWHPWVAGPGRGTAPNDRHLPGELTRG
jgi:uncharacterized RDD family membrane protein YckC